MMSVRVRSIALVLFALAAGCDALISPQHRIERARADLAVGRWGRASIELRKVVQADPANREAWLALATLSLDAADSSGAANALDHAAKAGAKGPELDALRVRAWLAAGQAKVLIDALAHNGLSIQEPDRSIALARAYNGLREPDRALAVLEPVLAAKPDLTDARVAEAEALAREGHSDSAIQQIDVALTHDPHSYAALLLRGEILELRGQFDEAGQSFSAALHDMSPGTQLADRAAALAGVTESDLAQGKIDEASRSEAPLEKLLPDSPAVEVLSARIKLTRRDYLGGISDLEHAIQHAPNYLPAHMLLGAAQLAQGNLEQAGTELEQVVRQAPDNIEARKLLASVQLKRGQPEDALRILTPALGERAADPQLYSLLGQAGQRVGNANSVIAALERAVQAHPQDRNLRLNLAGAYLTANRAKDALAILEQTPDVASDLRRDNLLVSALTTVRGPTAGTAEVNKLLAAHPNEQDMLDFAAIYFASQRQFDRARALIHTALRPNGLDVASLTTLARVDMAAGDEMGAQSALQTALAVAPNNLAVRIALADVLARRKNFDQAEQLLATADGPHVPPALPFALARVELAHGEVKKANAALDHAIALAPGRAELVNEAGTLLLDSREYDAALARFRRAAEMSPDNADYWLNVGRAQLALDHTDAARESLEKANQLQPQWVPAVSALVLIDLREKNAQSALGRVQSLLAAHPSDPDALVLEGDVDMAVGQLDRGLAAYSDAQRRRATASVAVKLFQAELSAGRPHPDEPLEQWLTAQPNDTAVRTALADYYLVVKRNYEQAARQFQAVVDKAPDNAVALNNLAWTYLQLRDPRAESIAERAYKLRPGMPNVEDTLGWILALKHATNQALPLLTQAAKLDATDLDLQYHYAYVLAQSGKRSEAREILSKVLAGKREFDSRRDAERLLASLTA